MAMILLYYVLLAVWPLLLWPALRLKGWSRGWLIVTAVAGALATAHEVRMFFGPPAAIRLDVFLIAMVLGVLYAGAAAVLFLGRRRKSAAVVGVAIVLIGGGMSYLSIEAGRQTERLTAAFYAGQALLFEAKFRSPEAYAAYFRMFDARPTLAPVGHWAAQGEGGYFTRLIINPEGRAWAFYPCGLPSPVTECDYRSDDAGVRPAGDAAEQRWEVTLMPPSGPAMATVRLAQTGPGPPEARGLRGGHARQDAAADRSRSGAQGPELPRAVRAGGMPGPGCRRPPALAVAGGRAALCGRRLRHPARRGARQLRLAGRIGRGRPPRRCVALRMAARRAALERVGHIGNPRRT